MKNLIKLSTVLIISAALLSGISFTSYAAPSHTHVIDMTEEDNDTSSENDGDVEVPPAESGYYYLCDDLPNIVAVNRLLDDIAYGNESYFLSVADLTGERTYYDHTGTLTYGENNHLDPSYDPNDDLKIHGGQELRVTIFYDNNTKVPLFPYVGSGFFPSLKAGETGTIWGQVYLLDSMGYTNSGIGGEDRVYNVVPIIAEEDVYLEYVEDSLVRYSVYEKLQDGSPITGTALKYFFQDDIEETGLQMFYLNQALEDPHDCAGYVSYKIRVHKQPNGWDKAEAATNTAKAKAKEFWHSEPAEKAKSAFTDFMSGLGDQASAWLGR